MQERKKLEQAIANDERIRAMTDDLDTLFELAREGENVQADIERGRQPVAPPLVLTPREPPSLAAKRPVDRPKSRRSNATSTLPSLNVW